MIPTNFVMMAVPIGKLNMIKVKVRHYVGQCFSFMGTQMKDSNTLLVHAKESDHYFQPYLHKMIPNIPTPSRTTQLSIEELTKVLDK